MIQLQIKFNSSIFKDCEIQPQYFSYHYPKTTSVDLAFKESKNKRDPRKQVRFPEAKITPFPGSSFHRYIKIHLSYAYSKSYLTFMLPLFRGFPCGKELACQCRILRDTIPGLGRSFGGGNGNPLQYSCLENPLDRGDWRATVHQVTKSQT